MKKKSKKRNLKLHVIITALSVVLQFSSGVVMAQAFKVSSPAIEDGGPVPIKYTCDGDAVSMPVNWSGAPEGSQYFAVNIWHVPSPPPGAEAPEPPPEHKEPKEGNADAGHGAPPSGFMGPDGKMQLSYWLLYDIPGDLSGIPEDVKGIGTLGYHDRMEKNYEPMCPAFERPGLRTYHITVWALSEKPRFLTDIVNRESFLDAIQEITLAEDTLNYTFDRKKN